MNGLFQTLLTGLERDGSVALVTLAEVRGSSPRDVGARMAVRRDGGFVGSIGGGALEWQALALAQAMLATATGPSLREIDQALGPDLGQCCGGRVRLRLERFDDADRDWIAMLVRMEAAGPFAARLVRMPGGHFRREPTVPDDAGADEFFGERVVPLLLAGAGHVGRALVLALASLPFTVTWIDPRPDAFPQVSPRNVAMHRASPVDALSALGNGGFVLAMTHSHALDLAIVDAALRRETLAFVGVIGSATKRARFASQLRQAGHSEAAIGRMMCPIGVAGLGGKEPAVIAASVAAQLLIERQKSLSARTVTGPNIERNGDVG